MKPKANTHSKRLFEPKPVWKARLEEYVTAIAWSPDGAWLAAADAAGTVTLVRDASPAQPLLLQAPTEASVDSVEFSADGRYLAVGGQNGCLRVWDVAALVPGTACPAPPIDLDLGDAWIDCLAWHPTRPEVAFGLGKYVQVWSAATQDIVTTLDFAESTVLSLAWHPSGEWLTVAGDRGLKQWHAADWYADPVTFSTPSAIHLVAWDAGGELLAASLLDKTVAIVPWLGTDFDSAPWLLQGFPGKLRAIAWFQGRHPRALLTASANEAVLWQPHRLVEIGWDNRTVRTDAAIARVACQPGSRLFVAATTAGEIAVIDDGLRQVQRLSFTSAEPSGLQWQPQAQRFAMANAAGEIAVWAIAAKTKGFGS